MKAKGYGNKTDSKARYIKRARAKNRERLKEYRRSNHGKKS